MSDEICPKGSGLSIDRCPQCIEELGEQARHWLDQKGVIVLGETRDQQHVRVSLTTNEEARAWLNEIPDAQRETVRRAVTSELAAAGMRIKQVLRVGQGQPMKM